MDITCIKCGIMNEYKTVLKNNQNTAWCTCCGSYIKNIPYAKQGLHFGKYKGRLIDSMIQKEEVNYLNWLLNSEIKLNINLELSIKKHLNIL